MEPTMATKLTPARQLAAEIRRTMKANGWSLRHLARESRVPAPTLHAWLTGPDPDPRLSTVVPVLRVCEITWLP